MTNGHYAENIDAECIMLVINPITITLGIIYLIKVMLSVVIMSVVAPFQQMDLSNWFQAQVRKFMILIKCNPVCQHIHPSIRQSI